MKDLISISNKTYYGKQRKVGEQFRATNSDARMLVACGYAREAVGRSPALPQVKSQEADETESTPRRRYYRRRDLRAESDESGKT